MHIAYAIARAREEKTKIFFALLFLTCVALIMTIFPQHCFRHQTIVSTTSSSSLFFTKLLSSTTKNKKPTISNCVIRTSSVAKPSRPLVGSTQLLYYHSHSTRMTSLQSLPGPNGYVQTRKEAANGNHGNDNEFVRIVENRPYLPLLKVDPSNEASVVHVAKVVLSTSEAAEKAVDNADNEKDYTVTTITGGLTNALFLVGPTSSPSSVLVRVFGAEGMIDRDLETTNLTRLCDASSSIGSSVIHEKIEILGRFGNGRVETWVPNMRQAHHIDDYGSDGNGRERYGGLVLEVARQLARLHFGFFIPEYLTNETSETQPATASAASTDTRKLQPTLWNGIHSWIKELSRHLCHDNFQTDASLKALFSEGTTGANNQCEIISYLSEEVEWLQTLIDAKHPNAPIAFCHNDVNAANILVNALLKDDSTNDTNTISAYNAQTVCLIDYEYGSVNYTMYDIANFFNEHTGGNDNGIPNYELYPSLGRQCHFLEEYIRERDAILFRTMGKSTDATANTEEKKEVSNLQSQVAVFQMVNNLYWGIWGIVQAAEEVTNGTFRTEDAKARMVGEVDVDKWDYLRYGRNRLERYRVCKERVVMHDAK